MQLKSISELKCKVTDFALINVEKEMRHRFTEDIGRGNKSSVSLMPGACHAGLGGITAGIKFFFIISIIIIPDKAFLNEARCRIGTSVWDLDSSREAE